MILRSSANFSLIQSFLQFCLTTFSLNFNLFISVWYDNEGRDADTHTLRTSYAKEVSKFWTKMNQIFPELYLKKDCKTRPIRGKRKLFQTNLGGTKPTRNCNLLHNLDFPTFFMNSLCIFEKVASTFFDSVLFTGFYEQK